MELSLLKCTTDQLDVLVEISRSTFRDTFEHLNDPKDFHSYLETAFDKTKIENELKNSELSYYLVYNEGKTVAYFKVNRAATQTDIADTDSLELERIYVRREYQGLKIGNWIMAQIIYFAQKTGTEYLWLGVWEENQPAIRFYQKLGFIKFRKHAFYIGKDKQTDWLMRLDIPKL
ncbi:MAG: GNAT family N-acetyltransferase [Flavobacteriaceae bacterium]